MIAANGVVYKVDGKQIQTGTTIGAGKYARHVFSGPPPSQPGMLIIGRPPQSPYIDELDPQIEIYRRSGGNAEIVRASRGGRRVRRRRHRSERAGGRV